MKYFDKIIFFGREIFVYQDDKFITEIAFLKRENDAKSHKTDEISQLISEISQFEKGLIKKFDTKYKLPKMSDFSKKVIDCMKEINFGETISYKELAKNSGTNAIRAAASVCAKNLLPILIPCHRIIQSNGFFGKYAGGSDLKEKILNFEKSRL